MNKRIINKYRQYIYIYKRIPKIFNPWNMKELKEIATTITCSVGHWDGTSCILIAEYEEDKKI